MKQLRIILQSNIFYIIIITITLIYVIINVNINKKSIYNPNNHVFYGEIIKIKEKDYKYSLIIKGKENLIVYTEKSNYQLGDYVKINGDLEKPNSNTIINNFNYKEYLKYYKIYYILKAKKITILSKNNNIIYNIKNNLFNYINTFKSSNYLKLLFHLDSSYLDEKIYNSYQINGLAHLLSFTSFYIIFISNLFLKILKKVKINNNISNIILFIILYMLIIITDYSVVLIRSFLYLFIKYLNTIFKLNLNSLKKFYFVIIITLLINPYYIFHKGFLYSYGISLIIILNKKNITGNYFVKLFKVSIISFLYSIPFNIYYNYSFNFFSIIYNFPFLLLFNFVIYPLLILTIILKIFDPFFYNVITFINKISLLLNKIDFPILIFKKIDIVILIIYLVLFAFIIYKMFRNKKYLIIIIIILFIHYNVNYIFINNFVMFIDVKQGDSSLISFNNNSILIDTGGIYNSNIFSKTILMLKSLGIRNINIMIITHGDYDHMGEAINLVNNFKVDKVIFNCGIFNDLEKELIKVLDKKNIKYYSCIRELNIDRNKLYFLQTKEYDNENDNSNVIYTDLNGYKFMFMGDASITTEKEIMSIYNLPNIDVLKVGHHGSKTSSSEEFINEINPKYSIISVGKNNRYGHPNKEVLDNLKESKIYRTDVDGSIMFKIKNNKLKIETCSP